MAKKIDIGGELHSVATGNIVADAKEIKYRPTGKEEKTQAQVNDEVYSAIGEGGSVETQINEKIATLDATVTKSAGTDGLSLSVTEENGKITAINGSIAANTYDAYGAAAAVVGSAGSDYNTLKKIEDRLSPIETAVEDCAYLGESDQESVIADFDPQADTVWKGTQVLSSAEKAQVQSNLGLTEKFNQYDTTIAALNGSDVIVGTLPASGVANKIYRVPDDPTTNKYTDYGWDGSAWVPLCTYPNDVDDEPTAGSDNLVKSGGVAANIVVNMADSSAADFSISDENNDIIALFKNGHIKTKGFDSSVDASNNGRGLMSATDKTKLNTIEEGAEVNDTSVDPATIGDLNVEDEDDNILVSFINGHVKTKRFDSKDVEQRISALEVQQGIPEWRDAGSRMPKTDDDDPLAKVRFDGGMCRIFRTWGFIGDSLNSGETYGRDVSYMAVTEEADKSISNGGIVDDNTSVITDQKLISGYQPSIKLMFESNTGLSGKILVAKIESNVYTSLKVGDTNKSYTISLTAGSTIQLSYPKTNKPTIIFQNVTVADVYDVSWGQQICRLLGASGYNFSVGGEYCKRWCIGEDNDRRWDKAQTDLKDVYTIGLGVNDRGYWMGGQTSIVDYPCVTAYQNQSDYGNLTLTEQEILADVNDADYTQNANSYAGWYAGIIQRIKSVRKDAHIFCITNPQDINVSKNEWNQVIKVLVDHFNDYYGKKTIWLVDLEAYNKGVNQAWFKTYCNLNGHFSAFGYLYFGYQISTYIDWIIRHNILDFKGTALIGSGNVADDYDTFLID